MSSDPVANQPLFTVIIPTYGRQRMLSEAISSIQNQTFTDWEIVVVDDHGLPPVEDVCDPRVRLVRNDENLGKSHSVNRGLALARGRYVCVLDDDDAWTTRRLEHARVAHELGADVAVCGTASFDKTENDHEPPQIVHYGKRELRRTEMLANAGCISVSRSLFPLYDPEFKGCEDIDWCIRLLQSSSKVSRVLSEDWRWRRHEGIRHGNGLAARISGSLLLLEKHKEHYANHRSQKGRRFRNLGYLYLRERRKREAFMCAIRSFFACPDISAIRLGLKVLIGMCWRRP